MLHFVCVLSLTLLYIMLHYVCIVLHRVYGCFLLCFCKFINQSVVFVPIVLHAQRSWLLRYFWLQAHDYCHSVSSILQQLATLTDRQGAQPVKLLEHEPDKCSLLSRLTAFVAFHVLLEACMFYVYSAWRVLSYCVLAKVWWQYQR